MGFLLSDCPSAIYMFTYTVPAKTERQGRKAVLPIVKRCESFADSLHINVSADTWRVIDGMVTVRLVFNIKEPEDSILVKVPALFNFAISLKLNFINQFFYPKEGN